MLVSARSRGDEIGSDAIAPATGALLRWLAAMVDARTVAEVGTGVGVSGLWLLKGMTADGVLTTVDDEAENTRAAKRAFADAGIPTQRTRLITGRPLEVLGRLADAGYDMVFLRGSSSEAAQYVEEAIRLLRPGGLVIVDNALAQGRVPDPAQRDAVAVAMRTLVTSLADDERVRPLLLPLGDGVLVLQAIAASDEG